MNVPYSPMNLSEELCWSRRLHFVPRWSVMPTIRKQSVAEHVYGVMAIAHWLLEHHERATDRNFALDVYQCVIKHDLEEAVTGDTPSPIKPQDEGCPLTQVGVLVKCADILEALAFLREEKSLGNTNTGGVSDALRKKFGRVWEKFDHVDGPNNSPDHDRMIHNFFMIVNPGNHPVMMVS